jgi:hypothetical protein
VKILCLVASACVACASLQATAQTAETPQARPDARYPNPSGHDSKPSTTQVNPTKPPPASANPEDARTSTKGGAAKQTYTTGKKADDAAGCSTPTTAADAGVAPADARTRADGKKTVCTTSGEQGPKELGKNAAQRTATAPKKANATNAEPAPASKPQPAPASKPSDGRGRDRIAAVIG